MGKIAILDVLKNKAFRGLWMSQVFSQLGINLLTFILALRVYALTERNTEVSFLTMSVVIPAMMLGVVAGVLVERFDKKKVLFWCNLLRGIAVLGFLLTKETIFFIYLLAVLISAITQFFVPAEGPLIPKIVPANHLVGANSLFIMTIFVTMLAGGVLAGPLLDGVGIDISFLIIAGLYFLATALVLFVPSNDKIANHTTIRIKEEFSEGVKFLRANRIVLTCLILLVGSQTVIASLSTLLPGLAHKTLFLPINQASTLLLGPAILGIIIGAVLVSQLHFPLRVNITIGIVGVSLAMFCLGLSTNYYFSATALFFMGGFNAFIDVSANTLLQKKTDEKLRSRVFGVLTSLGGMFFILPVLFLGILSDLAGVGPILLGQGVLIFGLFIFKIRRALYEFT